MGHSPEQATRRFELRGELGSGGMGVVYRVFDRARGREVAMKALRRLEGSTLYRFKREFRVLADLEHPNLVRLHDLYEVGGEWMFTMELVAGEQFSTWVRPDGLDEARLRDALYQLADGLAGLHAAGKLHRDIKPSNVFVQPCGRVVLLDFGLVTELERQDLDRTHEHAAVGTATYMSPEQASDLPLSEASDWYGVGVMLYEALTGRRVFEGVGAVVLAQKLRLDPPPPSTRARDVPADLERLCVALLARDPAERAGAAEIFATLGRAPSDATRRIASGRIRAPLVGRDEELAILKRALADSREHMVLVVITGPSGAGKTALLGSFLERARRAGAVTLPGRPVERENIPLRALDPLVDGVSGYLMRMPADELSRVLPADTALLTGMFPVLRRVPALHAATLLAGTSEIGDELYRASRALAALLDELARTRPLVVSLDDMQWAEEREAALIHRYEDPSAPHILIIVSIRTGGADDDAAQKILQHYLAFGGDLRRIDLT